MMQRFCYHARGIDHIETGDPCQDAFLFARCGRYIVFGGSDGVGSRKHSERGSRLAVASSVLYVASHLTADMTASEVEDVIRSSFSVAYHAVAELARRNGEHPRELDATLCVGVWDGTRLSWGNAGDSGIVAVLATGAYVQVTHQQHDASGGMLPCALGRILGNLEPLQSPSPRRSLRPTGSLNACARHSWQAPISPSTCRLRASSCTVRRLTPEHGARARCIFASSGGAIRAFTRSMMRHCSWSLTPSARRRRSTMSTTPSPIGRRCARQRQSGRVRRGRGPRATCGTQVARRGRSVERARTNRVRRCHHDRDHVGGPEPYARE